MGDILRAAIGSNATSYLERKIWQPFGMESDASWGLSSTDGEELGGCCISATLRDYARLGIFALRNGELQDGTQVLPKNWMTDSLKPLKGYSGFRGYSDLRGYGYFWWLFEDNQYAAEGLFGQMIFVNPESNLVIAIHSNSDKAVRSIYGKHKSALTLAISDFLAEE